MADERLEALGMALEYNPQGESGPTFADVSRVLAFWSNKEPPWDTMGDADFVWLVEFHNGDRGAYYGWHDYTGWDCQSGLTLYPFKGWQEQLRADENFGYIDNSDAIIDALEAALSAPSGATEVGE